jgi:Amt family ammonium transporter
VFARAALNGGHGGGLSLLGKQAIGVAAAGAWAAVVTFVLLKVIDLAVGLRVEAEVEHEGLDGALHGESAYGDAAGMAHTGSH